MDEKINKRTSLYAVASRILIKLDTMKNEPLKKATLANLRNSINKPLVDNMDAFAFIFENMPEEFLGNSSKLSKEELAIITSLQLYALHQQGISESVLTDEENRWQNMGYSLKILRDVEDSKAIDRRFNAMITASTYEEFSHYLRQMVSLLKAKKKNQAKVSYAKLAEDLFYYLLGYQESIRLKWSRNYYSFKKIEKGEENEEE
ncbi:MAG: type I-E CRISPR-associated protein Cse2/CasB [Peptoniphilaceae bacterium]|nr:type I-E CRISPR-associated protein Cse2/CasB [Peptoniphilaceae bacterium]MDY6019201.1 type I-E CRISPR-associated protein Cse2/CasB [Anaerococcus sp.]